MIVQLHRLIDFRHYARVCRHLEWAASRYWLQFDTNLNSRGNGRALPLSSRPPRKWLYSFNILISIECRRRTVFTWLPSIDIMQKLEKVGKLPLKVVSIGWTLRHSWVQSSNDWNIKVFYPPSPYTATWFIGCFNPIFFGLWFRLRNAWLKEFSAYYSFYNCPQQYLSSQMSHKHCLRKSF